MERPKYLKILTYVLCSLFAGFVLGIFISKGEQFNIRDWITLLGSVIGVLGAFLVAHLQIFYDRKEKDKEKEPFITLVNGNYENLELLPGRRALDNTEKALFKEPLCDLKLPIVNSGISSVYNVKVEYKSEKLNGTYENYKKVFKKKENRSVWFEKHVTFGDVVGINFLNNKTREKSFLPVSGHCFSKTIPVLSPNQTCKLELPMFVLTILQLFAFNDVNDTDKSELKFPYIEASLSFQDYRGELRKRQYYILFGRMTSKWHLDKNKIIYSGTMDVYTKSQFLKMDKEGLLKA
ncbi:hypothetical protein LQF61_07915 [Tetragenococcus koreensis]|uniref:hypothetical protein n=1 Tax=Tetragenococcus koreensis TaxID=290335 RepID=UPI001F2E2750|nr:hypothetical protein [Tetragenococcus koreensis]MCF1620001.1 hypothetical protein [Tetragenococcus koreensis]MCF1657460.1 hypothetical protein [Tetragenococcus koreensis]